MTRQKFTHTDWTNISTMCGNT